MSTGLRRTKFWKRQGFQILLVDTRQLARVPGRDRKTDPTDCEWIQRLHSCGLLKGSFRPREDVCMLRTLVRDKANLVAESGDWVRRMQKSLDQMNVRVHRAVSDIDGVTGMAILQAIADGERDARKLAKLRDPRCRKSEARDRGAIKRTLARGSPVQSATGTEDVRCDSGAHRRLRSGDFAKARRDATEECRDQPPPKVKNPQKAKAIKKRGEEPMREALYRMSGVDLTTIDAIGVETVQVVLSEYGPDLSRFPTEKEFVSHVTLAPRIRMSGGKPVRKKQRNTASTRVASALRMAALSLRNSQTALGAYYRRIARRIAGDVAVFATARKLATLIYRLLRWGQQYVDEGVVAFEKRYQESRIRSLQAKAKNSAIN